MTTRGNPDMNYEKVRAQVETGTSLALRATDAF